MTDEDRDNLLATPPSRDELLSIISLLRIQILTQATINIALINSQTKLAGELNEKLLGIEGRVDVALRRLVGAPPRKTDDDDTNGTR